jgi:predicted PurR-regulated permease PerM
MHPLIAFVTVIGALQYIGLWGIFIGPITASFFYALLKTLHTQLQKSPPQSSAQKSPGSTPETNLSSSRKYQSLHAGHGS